MSVKSLLDHVLEILNLRCVKKKRKQSIMKQIFFFIWCEKCFHKNSTQGRKSLRRSTEVDVIKVPPTDFKLCHLIGRFRFVRIRPPRSIQRTAMLNLQTEETKATATKNFSRNVRRINQIIEDSNPSQFGGNKFGHNYS